MGRKLTVTFFYDDRNYSGPHRLWEYLQDECTCERITKDIDWLWHIPNGGISRLDTVTFGIRPLDHKPTFTPTPDASPRITALTTHVINAPETFYYSRLHIGEEFVVEWRKIRPSLGAVGRILCHLIQLSLPPWRRTDYLLPIRVF